jgi:hypothetical protein
MMRGRLGLRIAVLAFHFLCRIKLLCRIKRGLSPILPGGGLRGGGLRGPPGIQKGDWRGKLQPPFLLCFGATGLDQLRKLR